MTDLDRRKNDNTSKRFAGWRGLSQQDERIAQSPGNDPDRRAARAFEYLLQLSPLAAVLSMSHNRWTEVRKPSAKL